MSFVINNRGHDHMQLVHTKLQRRNYKSHQPHDFRETDLLNEALVRQVVSHGLTSCVIPLERLDAVICVIRFAEEDVVEDVHVSAFVVLRVHWGDLTVHNGNCRLLASLSEFNICL
mgnify:CR=1 FL=1